MMKVGRRWHQFGLRSLLVLVTMVGVLFSWIAFERGRNAQHLAALEALETRGATIGFYDDPAPRSDVVKAILGDNRAAKATFAHFSDPDITDEDLAHLGSFPSIRELFIGSILQESKLTDNGLVHVRHLRNLNCLYITGTQMTDETLRTIRGLSNLEELHLNDTRVTDVGLGHISGLNVRDLSLQDTLISDDGLKHLENMTQLEVLDLAGTRVTDVGLVRLGKIKSLKEVNITHTPVTDVGTDALLDALPAVVLKDRFRPRGSRIISY